MMNNRLKMLLGTLLFVSSATTLAANETVATNDSALAALHADVASLRTKVEKTQNLIAIASNKSYRDPKGMKRAHWRKWVGKWQREIDATEARIAAYAGQ